MVRGGWSGVKWGGMGGGIGMGRRLGVGLGAIRRGGMEWDGEV